MENEQHKRTIATRIILIALSVVAIVAIGIGVALLLKNVSNVAKDQPSPMPTTGVGGQAPSAPSAASVIREYTEPQTIQILTRSYQVQQNTTGSSRITYKADGHDYEVSLPTEQRVLFYAIDTAKDDSAAVEAQTASYLQSKGFQKLRGTAASASVTTYTNNGAVCQLTKSPKSTPAYYLLACADKADVEKEYASIEQLLTIYKKTQPLTTFTRAFSTTITEGNKSMSILRLTTLNQHPALLFAAVDGDWEYLGDISGGNTAVSNGKYSLTPQVQGKISNPKYGDFLTKNLQ